VAETIWWRCTTCNGTGQVLRPQWSAYAAAGASALREHLAQHGTLSGWPDSEERQRLAASRPAGPQDESCAGCDGTGRAGGWQALSRDDPYVHTPAPQWTVGDLRARLSEVADDLPVAVIPLGESGRSTPAGMQIVVSGDALRRTWPAEDAGKAEFVLGCEWPAGLYPRHPSVRGA